jgi:hypothetical protein
MEKGHVTANCKLRIELLSKMTGNQNSWADQGDQSKGGRGQTQGNLAVLVASSCNSAGVTQDSGESSTILIDSGTCELMTRNRAILRDFELVQCRTWWVHLRDNHPVDVVGISTIIRKALVGEKHQPLRIDNILYMPELHKTLLSVWGALWHRVSTIFQPPNLCQMVNSYREIVLKGEPVSNGLFKVNVNLLFAKVAEEANLVSVVCACKWTLHEIHLRFGHPGAKHARMIARALRINIRKQELLPCMTCDCGKRLWLKIGKRPISQPSSVGHTIHSDVFSFGIPTHGGKVYGMSFVDGYSRFASMTLLKVKSDTAMALNLHLAAMPEKLHTRVLHSNQGGEYMRKEMQEVLAINESCLHAQV